MLANEDNLRRLLDSFEDSVKDLRETCSDPNEFCRDLKGAVAMLMEEACISGQAWLGAQLNLIMQRHGLPTFSGIR